MPDIFSKRTRTRLLRKWNQGTYYKSLSDLIDEAIETGLNIGASRERDHCLGVITGLQSGAFFDESHALLKQACNGIIDVPISTTSTTPR